MALEVEVKSLFESLLMLDSFLTTFGLMGFKNQV